jgi:hypothetical protein
MAKKVKIRFAGTRDDYYFITLGPIEEIEPREREFRGGHIVEVVLTERPGKPDAVDLTFADGEYAIEVPKEYFVVLTDQQRKNDQC